MRWLTPRELAEVSGRSERTIRHYASKGMVKVRKDGSLWKIEPLSAIEAGIPIPSEILETLRKPSKNSSSQKVKSAKNSARTQESVNSAKEKEAKGKKISEVSTTEEDRKYKKLGELGVYKDLLKIYIEEHENLSKQVNDYMKRCLQSIGLGFYEYSKDKKAEYFKQARSFLVSCLVEDDLSSKCISNWREPVENAIIPGLIGLIRKQERRGHAKVARNP